MTQPSAAHTNIVFLVDYTDLGGGETSLLHLLHQMCQRWAGRVRPVVIVRGQGALVQHLQKMGIQTHVVEYPACLRRGLAPFFSFKAARQIDQILQEIQPALIHANNFFGLLYAAPSARRRKIPVVWTCHGWFDIDNLPKRLTARWGADRIACVSQAVKQEADRQLGREDLTVTDYLGIPEFREMAAQHETGGLRGMVRREMGLLPHHCPLIAVVSRFQPIKGHALLLDALPAVREKVPGLRVWFIGDALYGSEEERSHKLYLQRRVHQEGLIDCVQFLGFRRDARRLMHAVDTLVIPSARESFSMVAVEGLQCGVPVVGPDGWGPKEIIETPRTGLLFKPGDAASLATCITDALLKQGPGRQFDPTAGPRRVRQHFSVQAHLDRTLEIYRSLGLELPGNGTASSSAPSATQEAATEGCTSGVVQ